MKVCLIALRPVTKTKKNGEKYQDITDKFTKIEAESHQELFSNLDKYVSQIPEEKRFNIYFSAYYAKGESFRKLEFQDIIPFDLDHIDLEKRDQYIDLFFKVTGADREKTIVLSSGNGLQFLIQLHNSWQDATFFKENRGHYKHWCDKINTAIKDARLAGDADTSVFSGSRLLRLPSTTNRKPTNDPFSKNANVKQAELLSGSLAPQSWEFQATPVTTKTNSIPAGSFGKPDHNFIVENCQFLQWIKTTPNEIHEPHVYAMLSITTHFKDENKYTRELFGPLSSPTIDSMDLDAKIEQARNASGPRTCENISSLWHGCPDCNFWGHCVSPIQLKGPDHIGTENCGFTTRTVSSRGIIKYHRHVEDLWLYFKKKHEYVMLGDVDRIMLFEEGHYHPSNKNYVRNFAQEAYRPKPNEAERNEFLNYLTAENYNTSAFLNTAIDNKINLKNGILDIKTKEIQGHSPKFGFQYILPYEYDGEASSCPTYEQLLSNLTRGRRELINTLEEFMSYAVSNSLYTEQRFLILAGSGANGKSTFINVLKMLVGESNCSSVSIATISQDTFGMAQLDGKLLNISEEEPVSCFKETGNLKRITGNTPVNARNPYEKAFQFTNRAKIVISYNEMPFLKDTTLGMRRRMLIVPFDLNLEKEPDKKIPNVLEKIEEELPAILNRLLKAYERLLAKGFTQSNIVDAQVESMVRDSDPFEEWFGDYVEFDKEAPAVTIREAFDKYKSDMEPGREQGGLTIRGFSKKMRKKGLEVRVSRSKNAVSKCYHGIKIFSESRSIQLGSEY